MLLLLTVVGFWVQALLHIDQLFLVCDEIGNLQMGELEMKCM